MPTDPTTAAAGQFQRDQERDMADPEYAEAYREASAEVTWTCYQWPRECGHHDDVDCMVAQDATAGTPARQQPMSETATAASDEQAVSKFMLRYTRDKSPEELAVIPLRAKLLVQRAREFGRRRSSDD